MVRATLSYLFDQVEPPNNPTRPLLRSQKTLVTLPAPRSALLSPSVRRAATGRPPSGVLCILFQNQIFWREKLQETKMIKQLCYKAAKELQNPLCFLTQQRGIHSRNKKAMELVAKGWSALKEVDRVIDYADRNDRRLIPLLRGAKENFELALEIDNMNTHARYWLGRMHLKYHVPGACKAVGAALLVEAANMGDPDAQYELGCRLRVENDYVQSDQQAFYYIEKAVDQLHPGALYLLGAVYLAGDCVKKDVASAMWCFHRASEKGHAGAAIAYGSLLLQGYEVPEVITRFNSNRSPSTGALRKKAKKVRQDPLVLAKEQFQIAADAGCDLGLRWLKRISDDEKFQQQTTL
ncbi:hypothetical protein OPV22_025236 [Ensete ventricosum]|uniref:Uncharacterized protein n=1 Tax=Ensete ventricosum TaxID=4639 RepID=A0AAV8QC45_ENSVE|nr:hypothetical protein OPV22_025236 [Ensete ventricosum]